MINKASDILLTIQATPIPFAALRAELLPQYDPPMASRNTKSKLAQIFRELEVLGVETTDQLTPELIARYVVSKPGRAPATVRGLLMNIRTICSYAEGRRYLTVSPFRLRKLSRYIRVPPPSGKQHLTAPEVRRLLELMRLDIDAKRGWAQWRARRLYALTATVAYVGLRRNEACCLWVEDIDLVEGVINLVPRSPHLPAEGDDPARLKTEAAAQPVAIPAALKPILTDWMAHRHDHPRGFAMPPRIPWLFPGCKRLGAWTTGGPDQRPIDRLKAVGKRAGLARVTWQMLRRSWVTRAEAMGIPDAMATRQCRHTSTETTKRWYAKRDLESLKGAVEGFDY